MGSVARPCTPDGRLAANLDLTHGLILGEAVMLAFGDRISRLDAHTLVEHASKQAVATGSTLYDVLSNDERVTQQFSLIELQALLDPANYAGQAYAFVDAALLSHRFPSSRILP